MPGTVTVGVIANPASGRDVRRLVSGASVFDNAEKGSMIYRALVGLGAAGVDRVVMMPAHSGVSASLSRQLRGPTTGRLPELEPIEMTLRGEASDTAEATERMCGMGARALVVLGGDGTHRVVAEHCGDVPVCALSTGTNNAFPQMQEATTAGLATGLVAAGEVRDGALTAEQTLCATVGSERTHAVVDVAFVRERWTGARALWRPDAVAAFAVAFARPGAVGLSGLAALLGEVDRGRGPGLWIELAPPDDADRVVAAPLAPGLVTPVGVAAVRPLPLDEPVEYTAAPGSIALDGEREIELHRGATVEVALTATSLRTIDVSAVLADAARRGLLDARQRNAPRAR